MSRRDQSAPPAQESVDADPSDAVHEIGTADILRALIDESVRSRLRHRALLQTLADKGLVELQKYVATYQLEEESNFRTLMDMLLLSSADFNGLHAAWLQQERDRFGYTAQVHRSVRLTPAPPDAAVHPVSNEPDPRAPKTRKPRQKHP